MGKHEVSAEYKELEREGRSLRKAVATARDILQNALIQYQKQKIKARNKAQVEAPEAVFKELEGYNSKQDIQDAYGWDYITDAQMHRFMEMWDARDVVRANSGKYRDRVTDILERAILNCGDEHMEKLETFDAMERNRKEDIARIERENAENDYKRRNGLML